MALTALRRIVADQLFHRGGWPFGDRLAWRIHHFGVLAMGTSAAMLGVDESGERKLLERLAAGWAERERVVVFDVGAHLGDYADAALLAFGPRAQVHCFEPNPAVFDDLERRFAGDSRARCHALALGAEAGRADLFRSEEVPTLASVHARSVQMEGVAVMEPVQVDADTVDAAARRLGVESLDLLKIDVEGHEHAVLEGATDLLGRGAIEVVQFEFGERDLASRTYLADFVELLGPDYRLHRLGRKGLTPVQYSPSWEIFVGETNFVATRQ